MNDMTPAAAAAATPKTCSNSNWSTAGTSSSSSSSNIKRNSNNIGTQWTASRNSFFFRHFFFFVWSTLVFVALRQSSLLNSKWEIAAAGAIFMVDLILCCRCWLCGIFCGRAHHVWPFVCITNLADWLTDWLPASLPVLFGQKVSLQLGPNSCQRLWQFVAKQFSCTGQKLMLFMCCCCSFWGRKFNK